MYAIRSYYAALSHFLEQTRSVGAGPGHVNDDERRELFERCKGAVRVAEYAHGMAPALFQLLQQKPADGVIILDQET